MEHLSTVVLARLVDEAPSAEESGHLASCPVCAGELKAQQVQADALRQLPELRPPKGDWAVLQARLVSEGIVQGRTGLGWGLASTPGWMKGVAALLIFAAGTAVGGAAFRGPATANMRGAAPSADILTPIGVQARTAEEAYQQAILVERQLMDLLVRRDVLLAAERGGESARNLEARLVALEYLAGAANAALRQAPGDPYLNGFVASLNAERQAALRRVSTGGQDWY